MINQPPAGAVDSAIVVHGLGKSFGTHRALDHVDLTVARGTVCGVLGPNGAGKTTLVRMLTTLLRPDSGTARILGRDLVRDAPAIRALISLTGQYASVDDDLTAVENLDIFGRLLGLRGAASRSRARDLVEEYGLTAAASRPVRTYSGGMRRRLDLAASMIRRPELLFLDEPTTGLDPRTRYQLWEMVRGVVRQGTTVLLTTQYLDEADALADHLVVIDHGRVVADGTPESLKRSVGNYALSVTLATAADRGRATEIIALVLDGPVEYDERTRQLTVSVSASATSAQVIAALAEESIEVQELSVHKPSLDDVFFALTEEQSPA
ncbi:ATP-binding cassette domain-containing protein [Williamsia sp. 1138]|uniref:ATP-binding cassette domain-containing protein n=1 Tax=Williamsia sp. 1138 TaxID=1903117 RepID=UPI001AF00CE1|nr:ATP-binding cassette domain-containing protein [Williamsia sp. 1138]